MSVKECQAKNPASCIHHGTPVKIAKLQNQLSSTSSPSRYLKLRSELDSLTREFEVSPNKRTESTVLTTREHKLLWGRLRNSVPLKELKQMELTTQTPAFVHYSNNSEASFDYTTFDSQNTLTKGACGFLALAIHERTNLPFAVFTADNSSKYWQGHVALKLGEDKYLDATGFCTEREIQTRYSFDKRIYGYEEIATVEKYKTRMRVTPGATGYQDLGELEKAILFRAADDLISDYLNSS